MNPIPARYRPVLASPGFRRLWIATGVSELGSNIGRFAFLLLVHDLARDEPDPEFQVALVTALEAIPMILLGPVAGALVDRFDRRWILVVGDVVAAALLVTIPWLASLESRVPLYAVAMVFSALGTVFHPARYSAIPDLVGPEHLPEANSVSTITSSLLLIAGTACVAPLIAVFGRNGAFYVDAASFLLSGALLLPLRLPRHESGEAVRDFAREILEGLRYLLSRRVLVFLTLVYFTNHAFVGAWWPLLPSFVDESLQLDPDTWAPLLVGAFGAGGAVGGALAPRFGRALGTGRAYLVAVLGLTAVVQLFGRATSALTCSVLAALGGAAIFSLLVLDVTLVQLRTEPAFRGRVFGAREPMRAAGLLFATSLVLTFASSANPRELMQGAALVFAAVVGLAAFLPGARILWRIRRPPEDVTPAPALENSSASGSGRSPGAEPAATGAARRGPDESDVPTDASDGGRREGR